MVAKVMRCFWPREPAARRVLLQLGKDACFWLPEPAVERVLLQLGKDACFWWNLLALVQRFYEPTSWRVLL